MVRVKFGFFFVTLQNKTFNKQMSDSIKHECGIAFLRLRKPTSYYIDKYETPFYALNKMHILMEKQHNRGQDGAGIACVKLNMPAGVSYINRERSNSGTSIRDVFKAIDKRNSDVVSSDPSVLKDAVRAEHELEFTGEVFLGHLRYGTFGRNDINSIHPVMRADNWKTRSMVLAGNFNLTNVDEVFAKLVEIGQFPVASTDTATILGRIGHFLDNENEDIYKKLKAEGVGKREASELISAGLNVQRVLSRASDNWDGAYTMSGIVGNGDAFVMRDPNGIRPAFYYIDDEVIVAASERAVIETAMNVRHEEIFELEAGHALIVKSDGKYEMVPFIESGKLTPCSFERIYFSRGTDKAIYKERKMLGELLVDDILKAVDDDIEHTVFSYIPNTSESAFFGMMQGMTKYCDEWRKNKILGAKGDVTREQLDRWFAVNPRGEKVAVKDVKMRTFITEDAARDDMVAHVYDVTYGSLVKNVDNLVIIDDSIVRGTTLQQSIIKILDRLSPKRIVIASSAPQVRYPDCYGIDMSKMNEFIAFRAAIEMLQERGMQSVIDDVYMKSKAQENKPKEEIVNYVKEIYSHFGDDEISDKISQMVTSKDIKAEVRVVYQTIENMHKAIPVHNGDWYFSGNYPTPGGNRVVNRAFINYIENKNERAY